MLIQVSLCVALRARYRARKSRTSRASAEGRSLQCRLKTVRRKKVEIRSKNAHGLSCAEGEYKSVKKENIAGGD